jgi:CheY-like chemotaxis protein
MTIMRVVLAEALTEAGHEVVQAGDGMDGLKLAKEGAFDLVITDMIMPVKDGIETIIELRRDYPQLPILAMSGGGRLHADTYLELAGQFGVARTIAKPFRPEELVAEVASLLESRAA